MGKISTLSPSLLLSLAEFRLLGLKNIFPQHVKIVIIFSPNLLHCTQKYNASLILSSFLITCIFLLKVFLPSFPLHLMI